MTPCEHCPASTKASCQGQGPVCRSAHWVRGSGVHDPAAPLHRGAPPPRLQKKLEAGRRQPTLGGAWSTGPRPPVPTHQRTSCQRFSPGARRPAIPLRPRPPPARRGCRRAVPRARSLWQGAAPRGRALAVRTESAALTSHGRQPRGVRLSKSPNLAAEGLQMSHSACAFLPCHPCPTCLESDMSPKVGWRVR